MKMVSSPRIQLPKIKVKAFADTHIGSPEYDEELFLSDLEELEEEDTYGVFFGDLLQFDLKAHKVGDIYSQRMPPSEQEAYLEHYLKPVAHKVLGIMPGNHEHRTKEDNKPIERIARHLEIPFCEAEMYLKILVKDQCYTLYGIHGNATTEGAILTQWNKMAMIVDADMYIVGHAHRPLYKPGAYFRADLYNKKVPKVTRHYISCKSYQDRGVYPQLNAMAPTVLGCVDIMLSGKEKEIKVHV